MTAPVNRAHRIPELTIAVGAPQGRASFEVFEQACAPIFDASIEDWAENNIFSVLLRSVQIDNLILAQADMANARYRYLRDQRKVARSGLDLLLVQIILEGTDTRIVNGKEIVSRPGDVFFSDLTRTMATQTENCRNFTMAMPRAMLAGSEAGLDRLHDTYLPANSASSRLFSSHAHALWRERNDIAPEEAQAVAAGTAKLLASLMAPGLDRQEGQDAVAASKLTRLCQFIEANLTEPDMGPDMLCREFGLSRASLYRLFVPLDGVANYLRSRRLRQVFRALTSAGDARRSIGDIAHGYGFTDMSAFIRAFKKQYGMTPSEARELARNSSVWIDLMTPPADDGQLLHHWLKSISLR